MKRTIKLICFFTICFGFSLAQNVSILPSGISPAMSGTYPRLAYDAIVALPSPEIGDIAYDITFLCLRVYNGSKWLCTYQNPSDSTPNMAYLASEGGTNYDDIYGIAVDSNGNVYISGIFQGLATFGDTSVTSAGFIDIFLAKYNAAGTLQWVKAAGGTNGDIVTGIAVDGDGNIFLSGYFSGTTTFDATSKTSVGGQDFLVAKYDNTGTLLWIRSEGGAGNDYGNNIATDVNGNVYLTGQFEDSFLYGITSISSVGSSDIFVAKYNSAGTLQWVRKEGGTGLDSGESLAIDASGNVYLAGEYEGSFLYGITPISSEGSSDIFLTMYNSAGTIQWVQTMGGTNSDDVSEIGVDANGNVYLTGYFSGTATYGVTSISSFGEDDIFLAKYSSIGHPQWVKALGGPKSDYGTSIALDPGGNVYISGYFSETALFGASSITSIGSSDIFVAKYSSVGTLQWIKSGGGPFSDYGPKIAHDGSEKLYLTGNFLVISTFGASTKTSVGGSDIFLVRLQQ